MTLHRIDLHLGTSKNPQCQANIERLHSTLLEHIRLLEERGETQKDKQMKLALIAYNNSISSATGMTPNEILFGHTKLRNPLDLFYDDIIYQQQISKHKDRMKILYEKIKNKDNQRKENTQQKQQEKVKTTEWKIGEMVYVKNNTKSSKLTRPFFGPYKIITINEDSTVEVETRRGIQRYHTRYLKHGFVPDGTPIGQTEQSNLQG